MPKPPQVAPDGWISVEVDDDLRAHVHITRRVVADDFVEIVVDGLYLEGGPITTATFPRIHPDRIFKAALDCATDWMLAAVVNADGSQVQMDHVASLMWYGLKVDDDDADVTLGDLRRRAQDRRIVERPRKKLGRPEGDLADFYRRVADAYRSAQAGSGRPAAVLAEENNVPVNTVHRWVKEARRRSYLAPARVGRAG